MALYHTVKGPVDYTVVGNPTIVDGVVGNTDWNNYIKTSNGLIDVTNIEYVIKLKLDGDLLSQYSGYFNALRFNNGQIYLNSHSTYTDCTVQIYSGGNKNMSVGSLQPNTDYWIKYTQISDVATVYLSLDGINYTQKQQMLDITNYPRGVVEFGRRDSNSLGFLGIIYLNNTYIKVNGQPWFGLCPVEVKKHQLMGPVGYTVVGSPTITDGVVSGFSADDYLQFSSIFPDITNSDAEILITLNNAGDGSGQGFRTVMALSSLSIAITNNGSPIFTVYTRKAGETSYTARNIYHWAINTQPGKFVLKFTKQSNLLSIQGSRNGETFTTGTTYTLEEGEEIRLPSNVGDMMKSNIWTTLGTQLDLNHTYIKVNGKLWFWQPRETERIVVNGVEVWTKPVPPTPPTEPYGG